MWESVLKVEEVKESVRKCAKSWGSMKSVLKGEQVLESVLKGEEVWGSLRKCA